MNSMIMRVKCAVLGSDGRNEEVSIRDNSKGKKSILIRATLPYICKELCY